MKNKVFAFVLAFISVTLTAQKNDQWEIISSNGGEIKSGHLVTLQNRFVNESVTYGKRDMGINLVWSRSRDLNTVKIENQTTTTIKTGELVAIRVEGGGYLKYESRKWGINLVWSDTPVYEWELKSRDSQGSSLKANTPISIYNRKVNDAMIYCRRPGRVINLGWDKDCVGSFRKPG